MIPFTHIHTYTHESLGSNPHVNPVKSLKIFHVEHDAPRGILADEHSCHGNVGTTAFPDARVIMSRLRVVQTIDLRSSTQSTVSFAQSSENRSYPSKMTWLVVKYESTSRLVVRTIYSFDPNDGPDNSPPSFNN